MVPSVCVWRETKYDKILILVNRGEEALAGWLSCLEHWPTPEGCGFDPWSGHMPGLQM